mgnify:CR=1 FL=1
MQYAASVLDDLKINYAVVGSFASMAYGMLEVSGEEIDLERLRVWADRLNVTEVWNEVAQTWNDRQQSEDDSVPF